MSAAVVLPTPVTPSATSPTVGLTMPRGRFSNGSQWHASLGYVPLERVRFDPWPGFATEADVQRLVESKQALVELVDGTLVEKPMGFMEAVVEATVIQILGPHVRAKRAGVVGSSASMTRMSEGNVRLPDISFVSAAQLKKTKLTPILNISAVLAVEVISPSNTRAEMAQKNAEYFASGTRVVWHIDPLKRTVAVYLSAEAEPAMLGESDELTGHPVLPDFRVRVAELFRDIPADGF